MSVPTSWSYSPDAAKRAWREWHRRTAIDNTSEAFMAGALWALSQNGQQALQTEIESLQKHLERLTRRGAQGSAPTHEGGD